MVGQIKYDVETTLKAPADVPLASVSVTVEIAPPDGAILLYGWQANGDLGYIKISGPKSMVRLEIVKPQIYVKFLGTLETLKIVTRSFQLAD